MSADNDRYQRIQLEDIQASPKTAFAAIAHGLAWGPVPNHRHGNESSFLRPGPESARMGMEREVHMSAQLTLELRRDPALQSLADWREDRLPICPEVIALAQTLGY